MTLNLSTPDLTQHPPRSPHVRLGGYAMLPRTIDKGRATLAGKNGEYHYNCPMDQRFFTFAGLDADAFLEQLKHNETDSAVLEWVNANAANKPNNVEIEQWSVFFEKSGPADVDGLEFFTSLLSGLSRTRDDIRGWVDLIDLDDYVTFGGKA